MNKLVRLLLIVGSSLLLVGVSYAYDCSSTAQYVDGSSYSTGAVVQNNGEAYQCTVGGWCTVGGPYAPGAGWAWTSAWSDLGACAGGGNPPPSSGNPPPSSGNPPPSSGNPPPSSGNPPPSSGNPPPSSGNPPPSSGNPPPSSGGSCTAATWDASTAYNGGAEVSYDGNLYSAKWWTQGDNPASHSGAWDVWNLEGACSGGGNPPPSSGNPPPSSGNPPPSSGNPPPSSGNPPPSSGLCAGVPQWQAGTNYAKGAEVVDNGLLFRAKYQASVEPNPTNKYGSWELLGSCVSGIPPVPTGPAAGLPSDFLLAPYVDVTTAGINWSTGKMNIPGALPSGMEAVTWAFATGKCSSASWAGVSGDLFAQSNVSAFDTAGVNYIVGMGGAAGSFSCSSASGLESLIARYHSAHMIGVDFDIEHAHSASEIDALLSAVQAAQSQYPNLRFSFTIATFGSYIRPNPQFNSDGQVVIDELQAKGMLNDVYINLMTMDYGTANPVTCVVVDGQCDMGQSAIAAAMKLHEDYGVAYDHIEVTPMIGSNDSPGENFSLQDADEVAAFAKQVGLAGVQWWALNRDSGYQYFHRFVSDGL